ncbi:hypothetical protein COO60DRAFT_1660460 [Scenedesmus sp. NREL 46B-D3]|nr:hypothetical protein COO60DRAFT_1660460 [Scenedesmus sp. NREL 46B-D3]
MQYVLGMVRAGGWFVEEALWMAVYAAAFCGKPAAEAVPAAAGSERRQQQQEQRQQGRREKRRKHDEQARQQRRQQRYQQAREAAVAPLREFLQELDVAADTPEAGGDGGGRSSSSKKQLLLLATPCLQLWEARRLMRCGGHMPARVHGVVTPMHEAVARVTLRLDVAGSSGGGSRHSSRVAAAEVNKQYKQVPRELQGCEQVAAAFTEGFKVLQSARYLLLGCAK